MYHRRWWTRRRIVVGVAVAALLVAVVAWECGSGEVREGQPLDEAKAVLVQAGAVDKTATCGMFTSLGHRYQVSNSMWELPDGHTVYLVAARDSDDEPFRVDRFSLWQGWPKSGREVELPAASAVSLRRSVFAVVPGWRR
jgi:hypothetical protein